MWFALAPELWLSVWSRAPRSSVPVCSLTGAGPRVRQLPFAGGYRFQAPERGRSLSLLFIFRYLCVVSQLPASHLNTQHWRCSFLEIQMYLPASQADSVSVQADLVPIQLDSGDQLKKGSPTPPPS